MDPLAALTDARHTVETTRSALPASDRRAGLAEWATPALFLRGPALPLYDPATGFDTITEPVAPVLAEGIVVRRVGESTLAAQLLADLGDDAGLVVSLTGAVAIDQILAATPPD